MSNYENPDLKRERVNCDFDKLEITHLIDGGPEKTRERKEIGTYVIN
jgi:acyl-CoA oxidase